VSVLLGLAVLAVYGQTWHAGFTNFDDPSYVADNTWVRRGLTVGGVMWAFTSTEQANWHPLTWLSHMLDTQLFGANAGGHHLTSVALHLVNTLMLFFVLRRMTSAPMRSAMVAALFALHPLHVESVAWIAERKDVLSTSFLFAALGAYAAYARRPRAARYVLILVLFALGLMAKPMLVSFPFLLLLLDYWPLRRRTRPMLLAAEKLPLVVLSIAVSAVTLHVQRTARDVAGAYPMPLRLANAALSYVRYVRKALWPVDLAPFYPYAHALAPAAVGGALLLLAGATIAAVVVRRRRPELFVGWFWYVGTLVPVIGLVQVGRQAMADRYTYVPLVGLFIAAVWVAGDAFAWARPRPLAPVLASVVVLGLCAGASVRQVSYWRDSVRLFEHALAVTDDNYVAALQIGVQRDAEGEPEEAARRYAEALRMKPDYPEAHNDLGLLLARRGDLGAAMQHYDEALRLAPLYADAHYNRGMLLHTTGALDAAADQYRQVLAIIPSYAKASNNLGLVLYGQQRNDAALAQLAYAVALWPDFLDARINYGIVLRATGQLDAALEQYMEALRIAPTSPEAHYDLGNLLGQRGDVDGAIRSYREALRFKPSYDAAREMLERALAANVR
jgi:tetratricopeptide (TPR) repeat protein